MRGARLGVFPLTLMRAAQQGWGSPYQHAAAQDLHRQQERQLPWSRALRLQNTRQGQRGTACPPELPCPTSLTRVTV